jgi:hypothetical protein
MPDPVTGLVVGGTSLAGSAIQSNAARRGANAQTQAAQMGIDEQRRQFDELQRLLSPYVEAGNPALQELRALAGIGGVSDFAGPRVPGVEYPTAAEAQQQAIGRIEQSPFFQSSVRQGEEAMLQNASATGGLRGGNIQGALAQFRPAMLQNAIEQQYARLAGITTLGQQSAAGVGSAGMQTGANVANLLQQQGAARAGGIIGQAAPFVNLLNMPAQFAGFQMGRGGGGFNPFGGTPASATPGVMPAGSGFRAPPGFSFGGP